MINIIQNSIGALAKRLGIVNKNLQMWLGFYKSDWVGGELVVKDKSTNSNDAKLFTGKALSFDGVNDTVSLGTKSMPNTSAATITFWCNPVLSSSTGDRAVIRYGMTNVWFSNNNQLQVYPDVSGSAVIFSISDASNKYQRFVVSISGTTTTLYIDGVLIGSASSATISTTAKPSFIASYSSNRYLPAKLSDFQIYNAAWDSDDALFDYNNPNHLVTDNPNTTLTLSNLSAYYALSEGSGSIAYDSSGGGNNGTITGATYDDQQPTIPQLGMMDWVKSTPVATEVTLIQAPNNKGYDILGNSLRLRERGFNLDGSGYAEVADDDSLDFGTGDFSIEAWAKAKTDGSINVIVSLGGSYNGVNSAGIGTHQAASKFLCYVGGSAMYSNDEFELGDWYHLVVTRNSGLCTLYIDTVTQTDTETNTNSITNTLVKHVGRDSGVDRFYTDIIDEPRLYNRALTQKEITNNYKVGLKNHKVGSAFSTEFSSEFGF